MAVGYMTAILTGLGLPSFVFLFGDIVTSFTDQGNVLDALSKIALQMTIIGVFIWLTSYCYFSLLVIMAERIGKKTRVNYLRAIL